MNSKQYAGLISTIVLMQFIGIAILAGRLPSEQPSVYLSPNLDQASEDPMTRSEVKVSALQLPNEAELREMVGHILEQELHTYLKQTPASPKDIQQISQENALPTHVTPKVNQAAWELSRDISDQILIRGAWTSADEMALMEQAAKLTPAQEIEVINKLYGALERGELEDKRVPLR